jgi:uncharacterized protein YceH (UPF0502 family)
VSALQLSPTEARVLGVLVEKDKTVPDIYPLSLNALVAGCNQKNNRDPVTNLGEGEVQAAIDALKRASLVIESSGARVARYAHNTARVLRVPDQSVALLATLMLRGAQTAAELRINAERLHRFADASSVEAFLEELATRPDEQGGALVQRLHRRPGERENRWAQLLTGPVDDVAPPMAREAASAGNVSDEIAQLRERVAALEAEIEQLRAMVTALQS